MCIRDRTSTIESILMNEKYKGSAILQKKFTVDFLSKKMKVDVYNRQSVKCTAPAFRRSFHCMKL